MSDKPEIESTSPNPENTAGDGEAPDDVASGRPEAEAAAQPKVASQSAPVSDGDEGAVLDASGRERPRFLLAFPHHPDLARLAAAFEAGNYALVREEAGELAERADSPAVRAAALELRRRIEPDPLAKYLLALTAALLLFLAYFAYHH